MALTVPEDLIAGLEKLAAQRRIPIEEMLREVIVSYFRVEETFREERVGWEALQAEALALVEKSTE